MPLTPELTYIDVFARWQLQRDERAREELVRRFTPLTRSLARRYSRSSEPFDDLLQVAMLGLLKAIDRYDLERGFSFQSFAVPTVLGEMRRYFRDSGWSLHVPRGIAATDASPVAGASGVKPSASCGSSKRWV